MLIFVIVEVCMKFFLISAIVFLALQTYALAQYSAQKDAMYIATLKAVTDYKINDEENIKDIEALRENQRFLQDLRKMMKKLSNQRGKDALNTRIYKILKNAGKEIYSELNK